MSRIGKIPVKVPSGVKVAFANSTIVVEGPKGKLSQYYHDVVTFDNKGAEIVVGRVNDEKQTRAYHGLYRNLLNNMVIGVSSGWSRALVINGVGYRAEVNGKLLNMNLGYSNEVCVGIPEGLSVAVEQNGRIVIAGIDKQRVGQFASEIRKLRGPEPYKGKGIKYEEEHIRRKVGKSGVK
ncbi:MAG: 50S ribosomal protein L6 [Spirochaetaceae bacterium]|jgi:large subunit ribosomal protein L6|nr:50S ribosomal protein L6 [Spirochaetaceae bacterium]GMO17746.1 MAG: 50S ribosomal protein L6 [Termitinemataceae bacterium]